MGESNDDVPGVCAGSFYPAIHDSFRDRLMLPRPSCPTCSRNNWRELGTRTYRKSEEAQQTPYVRRRYQVLFGDWFPDIQEVTLTSLLCQECGLVIYRPRPEPQDLDTKYRRLQGHEPSWSPAPLTSNDLARSKELHATAARLSKSAIEPCRVLDFGGGDGRLMKSFVDAGCHVDLVDYVETTQPGIHKLGNTLADVRIDRGYDWIIASHVFEHLADPLTMMQNLGEHLVSSGRVFVEVPLELWGKPPLLSEPVTHVNFFTRSSLRYLLEAAHLEVVDCRYASSLHPTGRRFAAIQAVARKPAHPAVPQPPGPGEADWFLSPNPLRRLVCQLAFPRVLAGQLAVVWKRLRE